VFSLQGVPQLLLADTFCQLPTMAIVVLLPLLATACSSFRSTLDLTAASVVVSPAICACAKKYLLP
jgi:hypothetical protein